MTSLPIVPLPRRARCFIQPCVFGRQRSARGSSLAATTNASSPRDERMGCPRDVDALKSQLTSDTVTRAPMRNTSHRTSRVDASLSPPRLARTLSLVDPSTRVDPNSRDTRPTRSSFVVDIIPHTPSVRALALRRVLFTRAPTVLPMLTSRVSLP